MANNEKGLIFFKLESEYPGDYTKNCGLAGTEIDGNFHFLRGMDISSMEIDPLTTNIVLTRFNGERITLNSETPEYNNFIFTYNDGKLKITYPGGEKEEIFDIKKDIRGTFSLGTTEKFIGDGSVESPLDFNSAYLTGTYRPVKSFIDLSAGEEYPEKIGVGDRFVTKELLNEGGLFYTYDEIIKIDEKLKEISSEWRVPTAEDWNRLLNSLECEEDRNHGQEDAYYIAEGKVAGKLVKSEKLWDSWDDESMSEYPKNWSGMSILPMGGQTGFAEEIDGLGKYSVLWTKTEAKIKDTRGIVGKKFDYNRDTVGQINVYPYLRFPLRLVKDFNGFNDNGIEMILGSLTKTKKIEGIDQIWTSVNVYFSEFTNMEINNAIYKGIDLKFPSLSKDYQFFISEWNGYKWDKIPMMEGDSVVLTSPKNVDRMHEWRVVDGVLVDTCEIIKGEFKNEFDKIEDSINTISSDLEAEKNIRFENDEKEKNARYEADKKEADIRYTSIKNEADLRYSADKKEETERKTDVTNINKRIDDITSGTSEEIDSINQKIDENKVTKSDNDNSLTIVDGITENGVTKPTTIKVNLPEESEDGLPVHIKSDDNGLYFDGYFGTF